MNISILLSSNNKESIKIIELNFTNLFFESFKLTKVFKSSMILMNPPFFIICLAKTEFFNAK